MIEFDYKLTAKSSRGHFDVLSSNEKVLATFEYQDWFASKGSASFLGNKFELKPANIWWTKIDISRNSEDAGDIAFNWKGHIIIKLKTRDGQPKEYALKTKGFWNFQFVLTDEAEQDVLFLAPAFKWSKLHYEYLVKLSDAKLNEEEVIELLFCCGYGANLYMTMMASSTGV